MVHLAVSGTSRPPPTEIPITIHIAVSGTPSFCRQFAHMGFETHGPSHRPVGSGDPRLARGRHRFTGEDGRAGGRRHRGTRRRRDLAVYRAPRGAAGRRRGDRQLSAARTLPLYGVPFGVKDSIDVAGVPTTLSCPDYAYLADRGRRRPCSAARRRRALRRQDEPGPVRHRPQRNPDPRTRCRAASSATR